MDALSKDLGSLKPKTKEPSTARVLNSWIAHAENDLGVSSNGRIAWLVATTIVAAKLQQVVDELGTSRFSLKGGTLLQHRLGLEARATKDLDGIVRGDIEEFLAALDERLGDPWGPIEFTRTDAEIIRVSTRVVKPRRFEMVLALRGDVWRRVKVEISPDEGNAGSSQELIAAPYLEAFGLPSPDHLVGMALSYQIAQKVHAASNPHDPPRFRNERPRDVVDLLLLKGLVETAGEPSSDAIACAIRDIFDARAREAALLEKPARTLPVRIAAYPHWKNDFEVAAASASLDATLEEAVAAVNEWLVELGVGEPAS